MLGWLKRPGKLSLSLFHGSTWSVLVQQRSLGAEGRVGRSHWGGLSHAGWHAGQAGTQRSAPTPIPSSGISHPSDSLHH